MRQLTRKYVQHYSPKEQKCKTCGSPHLSTIQAQEPPSLQTRNCSVLPKLKRLRKKRKQNKLLPRRTHGTFRHPRPSSKKVPLNTYAKFPTGHMQACWESPSSAGFSPAQTAVRNNKPSSNTTLHENACFAQIEFRRNHYL